MRITVSTLFLYPFASRTRQQKIKCILQGKPRPALDHLFSVEEHTPSSADSTEGNNTKFVIVFDKTSYDHVDWLTGCDERQALFCWPCILFGSSHEDVWNTTGLNDLSNLGEKIKQHESHSLHIQSVLDFQLFASTIKTKTARPAAPLGNKEVKKNREIAKRIIDVICCLTSQRKPPRVRSRDKNSLEVKDCLESLNLLRDYDLLQTSLIDEAIEKVQKTPKIIADMIEAITNTVRKAIQKELHHSTYVSVILSEHSTERTSSQISTVLRYLRNGEVCERFIGFTYVEGSKTPKMIHQYINKVINGFQIQEKVIAYSHDGAMLAGMPGLYEVKKALERLHFIPCYFHDLHDVLLRSLSFSSECDLFLKNMMIIESYFREGANVRLELNDFRKMDDSPEVMKCGSFQAERCSNYFALINTIKTHRLSILESFDKALAEDGKLTGSDVVQVKALRAFLADLKTIFLLELVSKLFDFVAPLVEAFKSPSPGLAFDTNLVESVLKSFHDVLNIGTLESFLDKFLQDFVDPNTGEKLKSSFFENKRKSCFKLYVEVASCMKGQIRFRFQDASKFSFCHILVLDNSAKSLNMEHVQTLIANYGQVFDYALLDKEIKLVVSNKSAVNPESIHELYKFLVTSGLGSSFTNLNRLCELVLTLPSTIPDITNMSARTKLDDINAWSHAAVQQHSCDVTFLCLEQDYLKELKRTKTFYDDVMSEFREKSKTLELG